MATPCLWCKRLITPARKFCSSVCKDRYENFYADLAEHGFAQSKWINIRKEKQHNNTERKERVMGQKTVSFCDHCNTEATSQAALVQVGIKIGQAEFHQEWCESCAMTLREFLKKKNGGTQ